MSATALKIWNLHWWSRESQNATAWLIGCTKNQWFYQQLGPTYKKEIQKAIAKWFPPSPISKSKLRGWLVSWCLLCFLRVSMNGGTSKWMVEKNQGKSQSKMDNWGYPIWLRKPPYPPWCNHLGAPLRLRPRRLPEFGPQWHEDKGCVRHDHKFFNEQIRDLMWFNGISWGFHGIYDGYPLVN